MSRRRVRVDKKKYRSLQEKMGAVARKRVKVGLLASKGALAKSEDGKTSLLAIAAFNEFGTSRIPERSFIRSTFQNGGVGHEKYKAFSARLIRGLVNRKIGVDRAFEMLGQWGAAQVRATVRRGPGVPPPNALSTIRRKKSARPLIHTGRMLQAVSYEVSS